MHDPEELLRLLNPGEVPTTGNQLQSRTFKCQMSFVLHTWIDGVLPACHYKDRPRETAQSRPDVAVGRHQFPDQYLVYLLVNAFWIELGGHFGRLDPIKEAPWYRDSHRFSKTQIRIL